MTSGHFRSRFLFNFRLIALVILDEMFNKIAKYYSIEIRSIVYLHQYQKSTILTLKINFIKIVNAHTQIANDNLVQIDFTNRSESTCF